MSPFAPRIVNDVSYVTDITHESHFSWQAHYLVTLEGSPDAPRIGNDISYVTKINHESRFSWQAQYLVILQCHFSWHVQYSVKSG